MSIGAGSVGTVTTNALGKVTIATPCVALSTAILTVSGAGLADPLTIDPAADVHAYLAGQGPLNTLPVFTGQTLRAATTDGRPDRPKVAPLLSANGVDPSVSDQVATAVNHTMTIGVGQPLDPNVKSFALSITGPQTTYRTSRRRGVLHRPPRRGQQLGGIFGDLSNAWRGIETGAMDLYQIAGDIGDDLKTWTLTLCTKIGDAVQDAIGVVVSGVEDALHAVYGILQAIGAAIEDAVAWLRPKIAGFLADVALDAEALNTLPLKVPKAMTTELGLGHQITSTFFADQKNHVAQLVANLEKSIGGQSFGQLGGGSTLQSAPDPGHRPPRRHRRHRHHRNHGPVGVGSDFDTGSVTSNADGNWLLVKVLSYFSVPAFAADHNLANLMQDLVGSFGAVENDLSAGFTSFSNAVTHTVGDPKTFASYGLSQLLDALQDLVDAVLSLVDDLVQSLVNNQYGQNAGIAEAVVGNMSLLLCWLTASPALKTTEDLSGAVKLFIDFFCGMADVTLLAVTPEVR